MAVVQSSPESSPLSMDRMSGDFISKFHMPEDLDECTYVVPLESIVHPLCVFKNYGGPQTGNISALFPKGSGDVTLETKS
jgi:hypothetical protein